MIPSLLITLREGLEAALIIGIIFGMLRKLNQQEQGRIVWAGVGAAVVISLLGGIGLNAAGLAFEGRGEQLFEGVTMLVAAGVLTWMIFWMQRQGRQVQNQLEANVRQAVSGEGSRWALFTLAFVAVLREGIETALFLTATVFNSSVEQSLVGGLLGLAIAVALGYLIFVAGRQMNLRLFFQVMGIVLLVVAAGLLAHGVHELQEAGIVPIVIEHVWDINHVVDEKGAVGAFLKALVGYNGNPSLIEIISYAVYMLVVAFAIRQTNKPTPTRRTAAA